MNKSISRSVIFLCLLTTVFCLSCSKRPRNVLDENKMVDVLKDIYKADGIFSSDQKKYGTDQQKDALVDAILKKHNITQEELNRSFNWYADNIDLFGSIQDTVSARLEAEFKIETNFTDNLYASRLSGFGLDMPKYFMLNSHTPTFRFKIDSTKIKSIENKKFTFGFHPKGIDTTKQRVESAVYYTYRDTVIIERIKIVDNIRYEFEKLNLASDSLREISGYIHQVMATDKMPKVILYDISNRLDSIVNEVDSVPQLVVDKN